MNLLAFIFKRATRHWQILATLSLGVLLATALLASGPILVNTVVEFGLRRTLSAGSVLRGNVALAAYAFISDTPEPDYQALDEAVQTAVAARLGEYMVQVVPSSATWWLLPWADEQVLAGNRLNLRTYGGEELRQKLALVAGEWPAGTVVDPAENRVQVLVPEAMAQAFELQVGDQLPVSTRADDPEPTGWLDVAGIVRPVDARDPYWFGEFSPLLVRSDDEWTEYSALIPAGTFFSAHQAMTPEGRPELDWYVLLDPGRVTLRNLPHLLTQLDGLRDDLRPLAARPNLQTEVDDIVRAFQQQSGAVSSPLLFLTAEIVLLALYYVTMVSALAVRQVEREFAILASRGMTGWQIFRIQLLEALLIALLAVLSGPVLGVALVRWLAVVGPLADVGGAGWPLTITSAAWLAAIVGALASLVGLLWPARTAVRRSIISHQQAVARAEAPPWWQRYYLDVFVLAVGLILLWRLQTFGSIVGGTATRTRVDWLLLLAPLALLLGAGTILLRLFPLMLRGLAALTTRQRGLPGALAMWQVARNPTHVARLVLLLTLAMALGILSTGLNATLDRSEAERAMYAAGSDLRLVSPRGILLDDLATLPGMAGLSGAWRGQGSISLGRLFGAVELLAVDPATAGSLLNFREDFAAEPLPLLLNSLEVDNTAEQPVTPLPGRVRELGIWVWSPPDPPEELRNIRNTAEGDSDLDRIALEAKVKTAQGQLLNLKLLPAETGGYPADGWRYYSALLPVLTERSYPLSLHSLWLQNRLRTTSFRGGPQSVFMELALDDLTVVDWETDARQVVDDFEDVSRVWQGSATAFNPVFRPSEEAHSGRARLHIGYQFDSRETVGLSLANINKAIVLPALASAGFVAASSAEVGDILPITLPSSGQLLFELVGTVDYFPTLYDEARGGFLITSRDAVLDQLNHVSRRSVNVNEVFVQGSDPTPAGIEALTTAAASVPNVNQVISAEAIRTQIKADPMSLGLRSVTYFGYVLTTTLSLIGFATYFYMSARQRESAYGVLRSIGLSPRQLYGMLVLEQVVLILFGLALGTVLGVVLNQITLPGLPISLGSQATIPPFQPLNDWWAVARIYLLLVVAFMVTLGVATYLLWRRNLHRVLRIGEE
ncbi:MAG: ABC transporter permease [Ardenticatenaceae bacterium]|nr:ABC transporter permease [Ardenticatenaceae bacterium]